MIKIIPGIVGRHYLLYKLLMLIWCLVFICQTPDEINSHNIIITQLYFRKTDNDVYYETQFVSSGYYFLEKKLKM